jgi:glycosyltransferase involved in cell wall biosynthesis/SAM-dependent methyltransferase
MRWGFYLRSVPITRGHLTGAASLGGSESACVGLAQALARRGHRVIVFVYDLAEDCHGWTDAEGVTWEPSVACRRDYLHHTWEVFTALRMLDPFLGDSLPARYRILWNQDLLQDYPRGQVATIIGNCWSVDRVAYVSQYHRRQWDTLAPDLASLGWVTRNGYDPRWVPDARQVVKAPARIIHVSRPERGLGPLLAMWPALKARVPEAELRLCRYQSMYDGEGTEVRRTCDQYDQLVAQINNQIGGITWLGSLGKADLYREIAEAAVMWYPGIATFAETSCIAAIEAQACGTPLVLSARGALPETAPHAVCVEGDATTSAYQAASVEAVVRALDGCARQSRDYRTQVERGRAHVTPAYTYDAIAEHWETEITQTLTARALAAPARVLEALLAVDDHVAAASWIAEVPPSADRDAAQARIARVLAGEDQTAEQYAEGARPDPIAEGQAEPRFQVASPSWAHATRLLDVACGNGAGALKFAQDHPTLTVVGVDYAQGNIDAARRAASTAGLADRVSFVCLPVYDYATQAVHADFVAWLATQAPFDAVFAGEFLEHCANTASLVDAIEAGCVPGARVVATMPHGPFIDLLQRTQPVRRGHVHHFEAADLEEVFGAKANLAVHALHHGQTPKGDVVGTWVVSWTVSGAPTGRRDLHRVVQTIRPYRRLSVGLITYNEANNIRRCLESVYDIADELVIGDTGSTDETRALATAFDTRGKVRVLSLPAVAACPHGFAEARNAVLDACTGDWFLWIDADEQLAGPPQVKRYLDAGPFVGYALHQQHLMADDRREPDKPVRLFARRPRVRFYGAVHEQPQDGDANTDIMPAMELTDVAVLHYGYPVEDTRRRKSNRNLPLLVKNHTACPDRALNAPLDVRELLLRAAPDALEDDVVRHYVRTLVERYGFRWSLPMADPRELMLRLAVHIAEQAGIPDPTNKYHAAAIRFYEGALDALGEGWTYELAFAGAAGRLNGRRAQPKRLRVRTADQIARHLAHQADDARKGMELEAPDTAPVVTADEVVA